MAWSEAQKRYANSEKGKEARRKYQMSEKGKASRVKYLTNRKGVIKGVTPIKTDIISSPKAKKEIRETKKVSDKL